MDCVRFSHFLISMQKVMTVCEKSHAPHKVTMTRVKKEVGVQNKHRISFTPPNRRVKEDDISQ